MVIIGQRRRRMKLAIAVVLLALTGVLGGLYGRQIGSFVTHVRGSPTSTRPLVAFPADDQPVLRMAVAGDVGDGGSRAERTGTAIAEAAGREPYDALLLLGDNVYPDGDLELLDDRVFRPFAPVLSLGTPLLAILGNHDVKRGEGVAMMERLGMPGRWWAETLGDVVVIGLDSTRPDDPDQREWLVSTLETSEARWNIVALHHPPYSSGYQGSSLDARAAFAAIFERFDVQLVLSGHEHDYERSKPINGVTYVVSGGATDTRRTGREPFTAVAVSWHHFVEVNVLDDRVVVRAVNQDGRVFDQFTLR